MVNPTQNDYNVDDIFKGYSTDELHAMRRQLRINAAKRCAEAKDILGWGKLLFPEKFDKPFCSELHGYFIDIRGEEFTNTEAPRNHAKTTLKCFLIPLFQALEEPDTFRHYLQVQSTGTKAVAVNAAIKIELETNEDLREIYGDQISEEKWTDTQFVLRNGVVFTAVGAGQSIRGLNYRNIRPDYIIVDDLYDEEDINNIDSTTKKNNWFWSSLFPARAKTRRCSIHIQGTAINAEDLLEKLKGKKRWKSRTFKAIKDWENQVVLWPELNTWEMLMDDLDDMGSIIFYRELQNERRDDSSSIIKMAWIREYDPFQVKFDKHFFIEEVLLGCDPSIGKKAKSDFTGIALVLKCRYEDASTYVYYIADVWNKKLSLDKRVLLLDEIGKDQPEDRPINQAIIEGISGFQDFVEEVRRRTDLPVCEVDEVKDKISNMEHKSKFFEQQKVFINKNIQGDLKTMLIHQLTTNNPKHDDIRDAVFLCLDHKSGDWNFV